jgi:hypothetical protein
LVEEKANTAALVSTVPELALVSFVFGAWPCALWPRFVSLMLEAFMQLTRALNRPISLSMSRHTSTGYFADEETAGTAARKVAFDDAPGGKLGTENVSRPSRPPPLEPPNARAPVVAGTV